MDGQTVIWSPQPGPQHAYVECPLPIVFFGGARGGGKTDGVLGKWALKAQMYGRNFNAIFFRKSTVSAEDAIERSRELYTPIGGKFSESKLIWRMPRGGRVSFKYLESVSDADQYQGRNVTDACVEEAGLYPDPAPIDRLHGVLRSRHGVPTQLTLLANPGGAGQQWLRDRFRLHPFPRGPVIIPLTIPNLFTGEDEIVQMAVIPAKLTDNKKLLEADPGYVARLSMSGGEKLVRAWLLGDWSAIEGAFFDEWASDLHIVQPFSIPSHWLKFGAFDWGSSKPFSMGWYAVVPDDVTINGRQFPCGALIKYREWYGKKGPNQGLKLTAEKIAQGIIEREGTETINYRVADPACFAEDGGPSHAERMANEQAIFWPADNKRIGRDGHMAGWDLVRARLLGHGYRDDKGVAHVGPGEPMLYFFSTCEDSIRTIPVLQHDLRRAEDLDTDAEDHCFSSDTAFFEKNGEIYSVGRWRKYRNARKTRRGALLLMLTFDDGSAVKCTPNHRFWTTSGWVEARNLLRKTLPLSRPPGRTSEDCVTTFAELTSCAPGAEISSGAAFDFTRRFVSYVALSIRQLRFWLAARNTATKTAGQLHCVHVEVFGRADVYCLTVPSTAAFTLSNGLTVSNCADELRYGCASRPWIPGDSRIVTPALDAWGRPRHDKASWKVA